MAVSDISDLQEPSEKKILSDVKALHANDELSAFPNDIIDINGDKLLFILSILRKEKIKLPLVSSREWMDLLNILNVHGVVPYFYRQMTRNTPLLLPPPEVMAEMRKNFLRTASKAVVIENVVKDVVTAFDREGIDVLLVKGPAFAITLYGNHALRPYNDLDLLVKPEDVQRACACLMKLGYEHANKLSCPLKRKESDNAEIPPGPEEAQFSHEEKRFNQEVFMPGGAHIGPCIEVHWNNQPFSMMNMQADLQPFFDRAVTVEMAGTTFKTMHPADALCFAASHLIYQHDNELRLLWILDIALLCESLKTPQDWKLLQTLSVENLSRVALEKSIRMAQVWMNLRMPEGFEDFSRWPKPLKKEKYFYDYQKTRNPVYGFLLALSRGDLLKLVFPSREFMRKRYPKLARWPVIVSYVRHWIYWLIHK